MSRISRREALGLSSLLVAPAVALGTSGPPARRALEPDLVLLNGHVLTMDAAVPVAEGFAVKDGRFLAIGSTADMRTLITHNTQVIDAARMRLRLASSTLTVTRVRWRNSTTSVPT
ncbi:MAG: hypothetical protein JOZ93_17295 [Sinobacteraceae bacterium]|nr:hypothetical protein [Nevskiaceae bacterium]